MTSCDNLRSAQPLIISGIDTRCETHTTVVDNGDGTFTATHTDGSTVSWDGAAPLPDQFVTVTNNGDGTFAATNVDGTVITWNGDAGDTDTFMTVTDNGDGTFTAVNTNGTTVTWTEAEPLCALPVVTQQAVDAAIVALQAGCVDGVDVLMPRQAVPDCVPVVTAQPVGAPAAGTGPLRADCNAGLWLWNCDTLAWDALTLAVGELAALDPALVNDICNQLNIPVWYDGGGACLEQRGMTLQQLADELEQCMICSLPVIDPAPNSTEFLVRYEDVAGNCQVAAAEPIEIITTAFDGQSLEGHSSVQALPSDEAGIVQLQDQGPSAPNNEAKIIAVVAGGDYLVSVKAKVSSQTRIRTARLRIGINGDSAGSITLAGWRGNVDGIPGDVWMSGSRVFRNLNPGDTVHAYGQASTINGTDPVNYSLVTLSTELSVV